MKVNGPSTTVGENNYILYSLFPIRLAIIYFKGGRKELLFKYDYGFDESIFYIIFVFQSQKGADGLKSTNVNCNTCLLFPGSNF